MASAISNLASCTLNSHVLRVCAALTCITWAGATAGEVSGSTEAEAGRPREIAFAGSRPVYFAWPPRRAETARTIGHLHGMCYPPSYSCGKWLDAAHQFGALVCPTGNARCGDAGIGPPSWEAPSWEALIAAMDGDLEQSIARVNATGTGVLRRQGAVLTGFSRGAYAAAAIAQRHPRRWPFLILIEADVPLSATTLRKAGVRAVALVAGERGTEIRGERKTVATLTNDGFPARLLVMPNVAHQYADDMNSIMAEALTFVLGHEGED